MALIMLAVAAAAVGAVVGRWWLLALPLAAAAGAAFLVAMPGTRIDQDNPLAFLVILLELGLLVGILLRKRWGSTGSRKPISIFRDGR
jgi:hypothetical protein